METRPKKLLDQVRAALRARHYPAHAEEACVAWITRFILFHNKRHPDTLAAPDVLAFLNSLTAAAERTEARTAVLFLYRQVLNHPLDLPADPPAPSAYPLRSGAPDLATLLDQTREALRVKHYAYRTEQAYLDWVKRFVRYHDNRHPSELGGAETCPEPVEGSRRSSPTWP